MKASAVVFILNFLAASGAPVGEVVCRQFPNTNYLED